LDFGKINNIFKANSSGLTDTPGDIKITNKIGKSQEQSSTDCNLRAIATRSIGLRTMGNVRGEHKYEEFLNLTYIGETSRGGPEKKYNQDGCTLYTYSKKYLPGAVGRLGNFIL
jgi:hypothetical protein